MEYVRESIGGDVSEREREERGKGRRGGNGRGGAYT